MSDKKLNNQIKIDNKNTEFWDEMCGSGLASSLGVSDFSVESLKKFDDYFFDFYPYADDYIEISDAKNKKVLEIGLGYGSLSQKLVEAGAIYHGLDIAHGPVNLVNERIKLMGATGHATQGSILECPYEDEYFDRIIAIGCFHHTGDTQKALDEAFRVLKPGGTAHIMVYAAYSYRRILFSKKETLQYFLSDKFGFNVNPTITDEQRAAYDANSKGEAAPHTDFYSKAHIRRMTQKWSGKKMWLQNMNDSGFFRYIGRNNSLKYLGWLIGGDLYAKLTK